MQSGPCCDFSLIPSSLCCIHTHSALCKGNKVLEACQSAGPSVFAWLSSTLLRGSNQHPESTPLHNWLSACFGSSVPDKVSSQQNDVESSPLNYSGDPTHKLGRLHVLCGLLPHLHPACTEAVLEALAACIASTNPDRNSLQMPDTSHSRAALLACASASLLGAFSKGSVNTQQQQQQQSQKQHHTQQQQQQQKQQQSCTQQQTLQARVHELIVQHLLPWLLDHHAQVCEWVEYALFSLKAAYFL